MEELKLNLCSGGVNKENYINIDKNAQTCPNIVLDIVKDPLPYEDATVDVVWFSHGIEHIERFHWDYVFMEVRRVLKNDSRLILVYPEFAKCAQNYIKAMEENDSKADYWLQTLYGRRAWIGDEHVTAVNSRELQLILESCGYRRIRFCEETPTENYNSIMVAFKDPAPQYREKVMCNEMGLPGKPKGIQEIALITSGHLV